ncbi:hypothetical protein BH24ACT4_BH24ACT4_16680 [soil metagenome]
MRSKWVTCVHRWAIGSNGASRHDGPFATADARLVLALLIVTALAVTAWIGFERRRPDDTSAPRPVVQQPVVGLVV